MEDELRIWFSLLNYKPSEYEFLQSMSFFSKKRTCVRIMMEQLSSQESIAEQETAIKYLTDNLLPAELIYLVLPPRYAIDSFNKGTIFLAHIGEKSRWENAAKVIINIGWPKVDHILVPLFLWLLDPNWPGSQLIYNFLLTLPIDVLCRKMKTIIANPHHYKPYDYEDLMERIEGLCNDLCITLQ